MKNLINIITASTNLAAIAPLYISWTNNDMITFTLTTLAASASAISHLFESHKHGLHGFGTKPIVSYYLNRIDVVAAHALFCRVGYLFYNNYQTMNINDIYITLASLSIFGLCGAISEKDLSESTKFRYCIFHNIWHVGIFGTLAYFLWSGRSSTI